MFIFGAGTENVVIVKTHLQRSRVEAALYRRPITSADYETLTTHANTHRRKQRTTSTDKQRNGITMAVNECYHR